MRFLCCNNRLRPVREPLYTVAGLMFDALPRPLLFAHRGASVEAPENTLEAFRRALEVGAQVIELDVHRSRDGTLVVIHDTHVDRTTDGRGRVRNMTWKDLKRLDAGCNFNNPKGGHGYRGKRVRIPSLGDVLDALPHAALNIEIKADEPGIVDDVAEVLSGFPPTRVLLTAGDETIMKRLEEASLPYPLGMSFAAIRRVLLQAWTGLSMPPCYRGRALQIPPRWRWFPVANRRLCAWAERAGLEVHLWTINDARAAARWLRLGVDGIMTDNPAELQPVFEVHRPQEFVR